MVGHCPVGISCRFIERYAVRLPIAESAVAKLEQMAQAVEDWQRLALKLSNAGYLVLDSTAVIAAPEDVYVRTEGR